ncbi:MAG: LLM class F420-dependent oxidoreductase [Alphaproteobacteria bacterium]|jgi:probable F420-dependent oxidoreductase
MHVGVAMFMTDYSISPTELAKALEDRGFESLWLPEHSHIPLSRKSGFPQGGDLPKKYYDIMDPFPVAAAAAAVTTKLKFGTGVCLVAQRDPIQTAKSVATVDHISAGRFLFGVGIGWNQDEMENHGRPFNKRITVAREHIEAMKQIWTQTKAEYHGQYVDFDPMMTWPKPVQTPHPPIWVGGGLVGGAKRALQYGDGWLPHAFRPEYRLIDKLDEWKAMEQAAGRSVPVTPFGAEHDPDIWPDYVEAGMERIVISMASESADVVLPKLDAMAAGVARVAGN